MTNQPRVIVGPKMIAVLVVGQLGRLGGKISVGVGVISWRPSSLLPPNGTLESTGLRQRFRLPGPSVHRSGGFDCMHAVMKRLPR